MVVAAPAAAVEACEAMEEAATAGMVDACAALEALADEVTAAAVMRNHFDCARTPVLYWESPIRLMV